MTSSHISDDRLGRFLDDSMDPEEAADVAGHIDDCPQCSARARGLDPLQPMFAACSDPPTPESLRLGVLAHLEKPGLQSPRLLWAAGIAAAVVIMAISVVGSLGALDLSAQADGSEWVGSVGSANPAWVFVWVGLGVVVALVAGAVAIGRNES